MPVAVGERLLECEQPLAEVVEFLVPLGFNAFRTMNRQDILKSSVVVAGFEARTACLFRIAKSSRFQGEALESAASLTSAAVAVAIKYWAIQKPEWSEASRSQVLSPKA